MTKHLVLLNHDLSKKQKSAWRYLTGPKMKIQQISPESHLLFQLDQWCHTLDIPLVLQWAHCQSDNSTNNGNISTWNYHYRSNSSIWPHDTQPNHSVLDIFWSCLWKWYPTLGKSYRHNHWWFYIWENLSLLQACMFLNSLENCASKCALDNIFQFCHLNMLWFLARTFFFCLWFCKLWFCTDSRFIEFVFDLKIPEIIFMM